MREPRGDIVISICACGGYELCEEKCIKADIGTGRACSGGVVIEEV